MGIFGSWMSEETDRTEGRELECCQDWERSKASKEIFGRRLWAGRTFERRTETELRMYRITEEGVWNLRERDGFWRAGKEWRRGTVERERDTEEGEGGGTEREKDEK
ncbi:hypothetical protein Tco_1292262 [Tanacetum coccineum]